MGTRWAPYFGNDFDPKKEQNCRMKCMYCGGDFNKFSDAHIVPEGLGQSETKAPNVCTGCNNKTNTLFENKVITAFRFLRYVLQIPGKKMKAGAALDIEFEFEGVTIEKTYRKQNEVLDDVLVFFKRRSTPEGKDEVTLVGSKEKIESRAKEIGAKKKMIWTYSDADPYRDIAGRSGFDVSVLFSPEILRLAAKIAYEFWCAHRGAHFANFPEYKAIKDYIMLGKEPGYRIVNLCNDPRADPQCGGIPFGIHSILIAQDPRTPYLVAYVGIFSIVCYKVYLSVENRCVSPQREFYLHTINPQSGQEYNPQILQPDAKFPQIAQRTNLDLISPEDTAKKMFPVIQKRIVDGIQNLQKKVEAGAKKRPG
jgi:hypothetical protein